LKTSSFFVAASFGMLKKTQYLSIDFKINPS